MEDKRIYFCASIRGGREDCSIYQEIIDHLKSHGMVLTEHIASLDLMGEEELTDQQIHDRDLAWLESSDLVVAEVTQPSLGVGYELARAVVLKKPILCLYRKENGRRLSGMIAGCSEILTENYALVEEAKRLIDGWISTCHPSSLFRTFPHSSKP